MPAIDFFDRSMLMLNKVLDFRLQNQHVISSNIANSDTPHYIPMKLEFEDNLRRAMEQPVTKKVEAATPGHVAIGGGSNLDTVRAEIRRKSENVINYGDRNAVSLEEEMLDLSENQLLYETTTQLLKKKIGMLKFVLQNSGG